MGFFYSKHFPEAKKLIQVIHGAAAKMSRPVIKHEGKILIYFLKGYLFYIKQRLNLLLIILFVVLQNGHLQQDSSLSKSGPFHKSSRSCIGMFTIFYYLHTIYQNMNNSCGILVRLFKRGMIGNCSRIKYHHISIIANF